MATTPTRVLARGSFRRMQSDCGAALHASRPENDLVPRSRTQADREAAKREERLLDCADLALALIKVGQRRVIIELNPDYSNVQIELHRGMHWTGDELHTLTEFCYQNGHQLVIDRRHDDGVTITIWPYKEGKTEEDS